MNKLILIGLLISLVISCEMEVATKINLPLKEKSPFLHLAIHNNKLVGEVRIASTNIENSVSKGISELRINIESSDGLIQSYQSDSTGVFRGLISIKELEKYRLSFNYENTDFYSNWIDPLPVSSIQTKIDTLFKKKPYFFSKLTSTLNHGYVALGVRSFLNDQMNDSSQVIGLDYNNIIEYSQGIIDYPAFELAYLSEIDSVELYVHYYDREYSKFRISLEQNIAAEIYSSFEPVYSNIGEENGLFCFYFTDTLRVSLK